MLKNIYSELHEIFKIKEKWWPHDSKFEIVVGAVLTQNTNWKNVEKALDNLKREDLIDVEKLRKVRLDKLKKLIKPAGFYNQKAERLKLISEFLYKNKDFTREDLLKVKGIGKETADSILLYAFDRPYFVIDAYTKRIMQRLGYKFEDYDSLQELFVTNLPKDYKLYQKFHGLLVEFAKRNCKKKPSCGDCALRGRCKF